MNIYVENMPIYTTEEELKQLFSPFGRIESVFLVKNRSSGEPIGAACINMPSDVEAEQAIASLDGSEYCGYLLRVVQSESADFSSSDYYW